jgi:hypothetical protein
MVGFPSPDPGCCSRFLQRFPMPPRPSKLSEGIPPAFAEADRATRRDIKFFQNELLSNFLIKDGCWVGASVIETGCAEDGAAAEGGVEGVENDGGEYCECGKPVVFVPG